VFDHIEYYGLENRCRITSLCCRSLLLLPDDWWR
jgi:hypothetical protein